MRNKFLVVFASLIGFFVLAKADQILDYITPTTATTVPITIANPGALQRNCLTDLSVSVSSSAIVRILDGGTTTYAIDVSTSNPASSIAPAQSPFISQWPTDNPFCASYNATLGINVTAAGASVKVNYRGQIRGQR